MISADRLEKGRAARVVSLECDSAVRKRLIDLGIIPGTEITLIREAPLGDPIVLTVLGCNIAVRKSEAVKIITEYTEGNGSSCRIK